MTQRENSSTTQDQKPSSELRNDSVNGRQYFQRRQTEGSRSCLFAQGQHQENLQLFSPRSQETPIPLSHSQKLHHESILTNQSSSVPLSPTTGSSDSGAVKQLINWHMTKLKSLATQNSDKRVPPPIPPRPKKTLPKHQLDKNDPNTRNETEQQKNSSIHKEHNILVENNPHTTRSEESLLEKVPIQKQMNECRSVGEKSSQSHSLNEKKSSLQKRNAFRFQAHLSQSEQLLQTPQSQPSSSLSSDVSESSNETKTNSNVLSHSQVQSGESPERNESTSPRSKTPKISIVPLWDSDKNKQRSSSPEIKHKVVRPTRRLPEKFNTLTSQPSDTTTRTISLSLFLSLSLSSFDLFDCTYSLNDFRRKF
jgi:hypothetical protein